MPDKVYDLVYVGAGNKNLINAMYATKFGGLKVGMFEDRHEAGGGWSCEESPAPGFVANHCSHLHTRWHHEVVWEDFPEWKEYGARFVEPRLGTGTVFIEDDTWAGFYTTFADENNEKTYKHMSRFSERDAETFVKLDEKWRKYIYPAFLEWAFNPPQPFPDALDRLVMNPDAGIILDWLTMSPVQALRDIFESTEIQTLGIRAAQSAGVPPDAYGMGLAGILLTHVYRDPIIFLGGNHQLAHASQRVILENGGEIFHSRCVDKIIIENGKAKGIRLTDGTEVEAKLGVVCGTSPRQLIEDLTGLEHWDSEIVRKVKYIESDWTCISWYTWALREQPRYKAEAFDPDLLDMAWITLGRKGMDAIMQEAARRRMGLWPDPDDLQLIVANWSHFAPGHFAPPDKACVLTEQYVQPATRYSEKEWKEIEKRHADETISWWERYCENVTWDNVIGYVPVTPYFTARHARNYAPSGNCIMIDAVGPQMGKSRPIRELADLRNFPVENLFPCSGCWHPIGSATSHAGYWVYKILAEKYDLRKPWEDKGRSY